MIASKPRIIDFYLSWTILATGNVEFFLEGSPERVVKLLDGQAVLIDFYIRELAAMSGQVHHGAGSLAPIR